MTREPAHRLDAHVDNAPAGDVVDVERDIRAVGNGHVVLVKPLLRRLVVIGRHHENRICAGVLGMLRELDCLGGRVGAGTRHHRNAARCLFHNNFHHTHMFRVAQRRAFAGGAAGHDAVGTFFYVPVHQITQLFLIHILPVKRSDESNNRAFEHLSGSWNKMVWARLCLR